MKKNLLLAATLALAVSAQATLVNPSAGLYNYTSGTLNTLIPDGSTAGITESSGVLSGLTGNGMNLIGNVNVHLDITGDYNGDLYGYLLLQSADGSTTTAILLNRVGRTGASDYGYSTAGFGSITLSGTTTAGYSDIHGVANPAGGTYLADGRAINPTGNFTTTSRTAGLDILNNHNANGTWTLFLADVASGDQSTLVSWGLDITVVPEPVTWALVAFGGLLGLAVLLRHRLLIGKVLGWINAWVDAV